MLLAGYLHVGEASCAAEGEAHRRLYYVAAAELVNAYAERTLADLLVGQLPSRRTDLGQESEVAGRTTGVGELHCRSARQDIK